MLLTGTDFPGAHILFGVRSCNCDQPYAIRTRLGWAIRGPLKTPCTSKAINANFQNTSDYLRHPHPERMWKTDFGDKNRDESKSICVEDKCAMQTMESSVTFVNRNYRLELPWRDESTRQCVPNKKALALARLQQLTRMRSRYSSLHQKFAGIANDYISDVFWRRWIREYLPALHARQKWQQAKSDVCSGDVVLVADEIFLEDNVLWAKLLV